jgi:hypothetical protein
LFQVDLRKALGEGTAIVPLIGEKVAVNSQLNEQGVLEADVIYHAKGPKSWGPDSSD